MNNNALITALTFLGGVVILAIVALAIWGPADNTVIASTTGQIVTVVTLIAGILVTLKVTSEAKAAAVDSKVVSEQNAAALEEVHGLVNGTKTGLEKEIASLHTTLANQSKALVSVEKALTVERATKGQARVGDQR